MNPSKTIEVLKYIDCISNTNIGNYGPYRVMWRWGKLGRQKWLEQCSMNIVSLTVVPLFLSYKPTTFRSSPYLCGSLLAAAASTHDT